MFIIILGEEVGAKKKEDQSSEEEDELGGLFRMSSMKNIKKQNEKEDMNKEDISKFNVEHHHDWNLSEVKIEYVLELISKTGKYLESSSMKDC